MKKLNLDLEGTDGNAYALMGFFRREAKKADWTPEEIELTMTKATSGDYDQLLNTFMEA